MNLQASLWDGLPGSLVRSRCFKESELVELYRSNVVRVLQVCGTSLFSLLLGYLNSRNLLHAAETSRVPEVAEMLRNLLGEGWHAREAFIVGPLHPSLQARKLSTPR